MKGELNPKLKVGDVILCYHMDGETAVPPGTKGVVTKIERDPFEKDGELIGVDWENGSKLALVSTVDAWKKANTERVDEQTNVDSWKYITENEDVFDNFDWRWLEQFLYKLRDSGIINMFGASPLLYSGKEHIDRYYGEGREDDERFQAVLDDADEAKDKIVQGVVKYMTKHGKDLDDMNQVNRFARHFSQKILGIYIVMSLGRKS
jgi:hypothetical protein